MADGINIGDATMSFLADTQQLDWAFDNAQRNAEEKLAPVNERLREMAGYWEFAGQTASTAGAEAEAAATEFQDAGERSAAAMR